MAINRYDTPAQAEFMNTYVPIPFEEMMKVGMMKQALVEQNDKAADDALASLATFQVAPFDEENYNAIKANYEKKLNDLYASSGNAGSYDFKRGVARLRTEMAMDPALRGMQYNLGQYQTAMKSLEEAKNASATDPNRYGLEKSIKDIYDVGGTTGLMKQTGSAKWTPGSWYKNVEIAPEIEKYIDNVAESSNQFDTFATDANGSYIISKENAGRSLNSLAAPFGLSYVQERDSVTGKPVYRLMATDSASRIMADFLTTPAGEQLRRDAQYEAQRTGEDMMKIVSEKYFSLVGSKIRERVNTKDQYNIAYDPKWLADYNRSQEDRQLPFTQFMAMGVPSSDLNSVTAVNKRQGELVKQIDSLRSQVDAYRQTYGAAAPGTKDEDGVDVSFRLKMFDEEIAQAERTKQSIDRKVASVKKKIGLSTDWDVAKDFTPQQLERIRQEAWNEAQPGSESSKGGGQDWSKTQADFEKLYTKKLEQKSPSYKAFNQALKADAATSSEIAGVSNLPSVKDSQYMEEMWGPWVAENSEGNRLAGGGIVVKDMATMTPLKPKEYAKLPGTAKFEGVTYSSADQSLLLVYRPYTKDSSGNIAYKDPVVIPAPHGTEQRLVKAGWENPVSIGLRRQLTDLENSYDDSAEIGSGDNKIKVVKMQPSDARFTPGGMNYKVIATGIDPETKQVGTKEYPATDISSIIEWYMNNYITPAQ